jgi:hypothetical protein
VRYLTVRFEKEEQLTGLTRLVDDDGRDEERDDRRRGGRRGEPFRPRSYTQGSQARSERARALEDDEDEGYADAAGQVAEETN